MSNINDKIVSLFADNHRFDVQPNMRMTMLKFNMEASIESQDGGSDAAYDLCGEGLTADVICESLAAALKSSIKDMLAEGRERNVGHVLRINIYDGTPDHREPTETKVVKGIAYYRVRINGKEVWVTIPESDERD